MKLSPKSYGRVLYEVTKNEKGENLEKIVLQARAIESLQKVEKIDLKKLGLSKKTSFKIKKL